ncbi:MAG: AAA family ATPase [Alistipes sp.]
MLRRLSVENYVLIDKLEMELDPHLNIITGETGAGKSILLGALGLLLGAKNDGSAMKDAARNCVVEGTFDLSGRDMEAFFAGNDLDYAPETTVTRMITPTGKSRAFINDLPVQLAQLREFGTRLIDIHSQHQNLILSSEEFRTSALDTVAGTGELLAQYAAQYTRLTELRRRLAALREAAADGRRDEEWLRFQSEELTAANLREGEQAATEAELAVLENADRIGEVLTTLRNASTPTKREFSPCSKTRKTTSYASASTTPPPGSTPSAYTRCSKAERHRQRRGRRLRTDRRRPRTAGEALGASRHPLRSSRSTASPPKPADRPARRLTPPGWQPSSTATRRSPRPKKRCTKPSESGRIGRPPAQSPRKSRRRLRETDPCHADATGHARHGFEVALTPLAELGRTGRDNVVSSSRPTAAQRPSPSSGSLGGELSRVMLARKPCWPGACSCRRSSSTK